MYGDPDMSQMGFIIATQHIMQINLPNIDHAHMYISYIVALVRPLESLGSIPRAGLVGNYDCELRSVGAHDADLSTLCEEMVSQSDASPRCGTF
jgi:hypothetical protein